MDDTGPASRALAFDDVLAAAQTGAGWALTRLYEWLAPAVAGYARSQGVYEPDDLTSEVFLAAFGKIGSFEGAEPQFRSWVFTIAYWRIVDWRRARKRDENLVGRQASRRQVPVAAAEDEALQRLGSERMQNLLAGLNDNQRDVLMLRLVADLTIEQVAAALGKSPNAVKALQRRALNRLRDTIRNEAVPL